MTNDNNINLQEPNEERLAAMLRSVESGAPTPDEAILESLRLRAAAEFDKSFVAVRSANEDIGHTSKTTTRRRPMIMVLASRGLAGFLAIASAVVLWLGLMPSSTALSTTPFSAVLKELRSAISLQLKVANNGKSADIWVRAPGFVRREETPQRYQIATGSRLWLIDEAENAATEADSPWFNVPDEQIDLLGLMELGF